MDRLEAMTILLRVVDTGSFSAASRDLGMPLASLSRKLAALEAYLGTRLLLRTTRKVALTDSGMAYAAAARRILDEIGETERLAAGEFDAPLGTLTITAPILFGRLHILPIVTEFLATYPDIDVRLLLADQTLHLVAEQIDMAVRIGALADSTMIATRVGAMRHVVCASPGLLAAHGPVQTMAALADVPCVYFGFPPPLPLSPSWAFRLKSGAIRDVAIRPRLSVSTAEAAVWAAAAGAGITRVLHYQCADLLRAGALQIVLPEFEVAPLPVHLLHAARGALPSKMRVFLDFAAPRLRERLAGIGGCSTPPASAGNG